MVAEHVLCPPSTFAGRLAFTLDYLRMAKPTYNYCRDRVSVR